MKRKDIRNHFVALLDRLEIHVFDYPLHSYDDEQLPAAVVQWDEQVLDDEAGEAMTFSGGTAYIADLEIALMVKGKRPQDELDLWLYTINERVRQDPQLGNLALICYHLATARPEISIEGELPIISTVMTFRASYVE